MSDLLGIGSGAVAAYRTALNAIGENVANSETSGYVRRRVVLRENTPASSSSIIYQESLLFGGVRAQSIARSWDLFRAADARITAAAAGRAETRKIWLTNIESALDDSQAGVGAKLGGFFNAGQTLSANPGDLLGRRTMLAALEDVSSAFQTTAGSLARLSDGMASRARLEVDGLNSDLAALHRVNDQLRRSLQGTPTDASLQDERDRILDSIAEKIDISVSYDDLGIATVKLANAPDVLVDRQGFGLVGLAVATDGRLSLSLERAGNSAPLAITSGTLAGLVDAAQVNAGRRAELDSLAQDFATSVNAWSAQGRLANGNPGAALLDGSGGAAGMRVLTTDPAAIAAASADGTENGNLLVLTDLRAGNSAETRWAGLISAHALAVNSARSEASAATTRRDNSFAARDEISGVDLDQEAAELMRYQQAYNSATKIIQIARETMQTILDIF